MSNCFIDYKKILIVFSIKNMEQHKKCGNTQEFDGVSTVLTCRVRRQVQVYYGTTEWFAIQKGVRQGCILTPGLFNLYGEYIIKRVGVGDMVTGIRKVT
jgi:hypothetical protein